MFTNREVISMKMKPIDCSSMQFHYLVTKRRRILPSHSFSVFRKWPIIHASITAKLMIMFVKSPYCLEGYLQQFLIWQDLPQKLVILHSLIKTLKKQMNSLQQLYILLWFLATVLLMMNSCSISPYSQTNV